MPSNPNIDTAIKQIGLTKLRALNAAKLKESNDIVVIEDRNAPLAVLLPYKKFLRMQQELESAMNMLDLLSEPEELESVLVGVADMKAGRVRSLNDLEDSRPALLLKPPAHHRLRNSLRPQRE